MSELTSRVSLYKPEGGEDINVTTDLNNNLDKIDTNLNFRVVADAAARQAVSPVWAGLNVRETDTGKLYVSNGSSPGSASWEQIPVEGADFDGDLTIAGDLTVEGIGEVRYVASDSNTVRNTTTSFTNVDDLTMSAAASAKYEFEVVLFADCNKVEPNGGLKTSFTIPSGGTVHCIGIGPVSNVVSGQRNLTTSDGSPLSWIVSTTMYGIKLQGTLTTSSSGNFTVRVGQNDGDGSPSTSTVYAGSYMKMTRIA